MAENETKKPLVQHLQRCQEIPDDSKAGLMYYIACLDVLLDLSAFADISRFTDYRAYRELNHEEVNSLVVVSALLEPRLLLGKCLVQRDELCNGNKCKFYNRAELSDLDEKYTFPDSIQIAGGRRNIKKILAIQVAWLEDYFFKPFKRLNMEIDKHDPQDEFERKKARRRARAKSLPVVQVPEQQPRKKLSSVDIFMPNLDEDTDEHNTTSDEPFDDRSDLSVTTGPTIRKGSVSISGNSAGCGLL